MARGSQRDLLGKIGESREVKDYMINTYKGGVVPVF